MNEKKQEFDSVHMDKTETLHNANRISCQHCQRTKSVWIIISIIAILLIIIIPVTIISMQKRNVSEISTVAMTAIETSTIALTYTVTTSVTSKQTSMIASTSTVTTTVTSEKMSTTKKITLNSKTKWKQNGITIAGGNGKGNQLDQFDNPFGLYIDDDDNQTMYIADMNNDRVIEWKQGASNGTVVAGKNGMDNRTDQLTRPTGVVIDKKNNALTICDRGNKRVVRWFRDQNKHPQVIIPNISCTCLTINENGDLYVSDSQTNAIRRWREGEINGVEVTGVIKEGTGISLNHGPGSVFVDSDQSIYVSYPSNQNVMKWIKDAKKSISVANRHNESQKNPKFVRIPSGIFVDHLGSIYVCESSDHHVMRWLKDAPEGTVVVGGNGKGNQSNQLANPWSIYFDRIGSLYVLDKGNRRVQKFDIDVE
ncbi:hypothetical protein I4U23_004278 [Adineta vaga]|nr:hypothetical protein I4U23_004278 [Adineta vaga]